MGLTTLGTPGKNRHEPGNIGYTRYKQTRAWKHWVHKIKTDTDLATLGTQDNNRHGPGNIGYTSYKQTLAWQHRVHKTKINKNTTQPREAGSIGYTSTKKNKTKNTTQPREAGNIGYTRTKKNKTKTQHNLEKLAT
jgi:hypothetical protein